MQDRRCFVQFIHPGGEHEPDHDGCKHWNLSDHKRKFLKTHGRYRYQANGPDMDGDVVFWGEWEPESRVVAQFSNPLLCGPRFLYEPFYSKPKTSVWRQNTDPFVFGDQFHYTGCRQHTVRGPTQLRYLSHGSLILFGSCIGRSTFVLDTTFVVADYIDHSELDYRQALGRKISKTYQIVTIEPWYSATLPPGQSHRLYFSATPNSPVDGMFSFFPCLPWNPGSGGFARPRILIPNRITQSLSRGKKISRDLTGAELKQLWEDVVAQVVAAGLALGTYAELPRESPPCHKAAGSKASPNDTRASCSPPRLHELRRKC